MGCRDMKTTNLSLSPLVFADGTMLKPGESKDLPGVDVEHYIHKTWAEIGMVTFEESDESPVDESDETNKAKAKTKK